ncbi:hypothetical protein Shyhy02_58880 [Streptomyces hygroscopicus subsp. hygroscopicus]|nr:hypothetical protein Shyhy02_58880 [Streptomyces hygroscopicus subsp. hygroscopicus]
MEIVTRMSHQMIYLGRPRDALGLLEVAAAKADRPAAKALVASQTGRVHAALGDEHLAESHLGTADDLSTRAAYDGPGISPLPGRRQSRPVPGTRAAVGSPADAGVGRGCVAVAA